ncbi:MAG: extracellular solute-binding protein [Clostridia bacterium]|nr:extracellular solute-binding protein [Clostridia bacterium]MBQ7592066.1 extracellular solute-binding protein [Clostridia bacterium]
MRATKRILIIALAVMMTVTIAGCGKPSGQTEQTTGGDISGEGTPPETQPETAYIDTLEKRDLGEATFTVIGQSNNERQNFYTEEKAGDTINESIQERDWMVEERLNVKLNYLALSDRKKVTEAVQKDTASGDGEYDLVMTSLSDGINTLTTGGRLVDLTRVPYMSLGSVYWNESMTVNMEIGGKLFFTTGPISPQLYQTPIVMMENKRIAAEYKLEDPYKVVLEGRWTIDKLAEVIKDVSHDLNSDGVMGEQDFWGLIIDPTFGNALYVGAGLDARQKTDNGYRLAIGDEDFINLVDKCSSLFGDRNSVLSNPEGKKDYDLDIFKPGNALFIDDTVLGVLLMRDMVDDFAIIPCPKASVEQERYLTTCNTWLPSGVGIPRNGADLETAGLILETMAVYSYEKIVPAVYEITLRGKVSRDAESYRTLDIIYENLSFDFVSVFNPGGASDLLRNSMIGDKENYASSYNSINKIAQKVLDDFVDAVATLD